MLDGDILALDPATGAIVRRHVGAIAGAVRPRTNGGLVFSVERGFGLLDPGATEPRLLPEVWSDPTVRMNEGGCDPLGNFYCGSMAYSKARGRGALYRLSPGGRVDRVLDGVTISNGLAWSPDATTAFYIDTPTHRVDAFDFDSTTGALAGRRQAFAIPAGDGAPDGMTIDAEGHLWIAMWGGGAVRRYQPDGRLDAVIPIPATQVTSCAFGGADLDVLYVTTSRERLPVDEQPLAGSVFATRPGVRGLPTLRFAG
jgi:sugar lactone lactonase YvrE